MIEKYLEAVSSYAGDIDGLINLVHLIVMVWFFATQAVFFWLIVKFRAKDGVKAQYITGEEKYQKKWITIPHFLVLGFDIVILIAAIRVWVHVKQTLPEHDAIVEITGQQWAWSFNHPGADGEIGTEDDIATVDDLHVEVGKTYHFVLRSHDVLHSFSVPVFRLKQDTIPGREITGWFKAESTGTYDIQCAEMCGIGHGVMYGRVVIETAEEHAAWIASNQ